MAQLAAFAGARRSQAMNLIELSQALRQLRLGGIASVLETRLHQAQAEPMAPIGSSLHRLLDRFC